ncbi:CtkA family protein [[Clostridium] innocuum]|uniref:CtkA family protein n=1 Tax=Clostridium innocuum TaxID=1522 RepID=UPI003A4DDEAB
MYLIDFNECQENNKAYGGMAGSKLGIIYQGEDWILKFPKSTKGMRKTVISYTTSPLSEYIGSHIYQILGYPVHETKLGTKDNKLVVACKDFTDSHVRLQEFREIKNYYNKELEAILEDTVTDSNSVGSTSLHAVKAHLNYNSLLYMIDGMSERFWDCVMIDGLINNNDRNSGNWGILRYSDGSLALAPVFDNGASFSTKISDEKINDMLKNEDRILSSAISTVTGYNINGKALQFGALLKLEDKDIHNAVKRVVPQIQRHMDAITAFIYAIPNADNGIEIISEIRKEFYIKGMELRLQKLLLPAYEHTMRAVL